MPHRPGISFYRGHFVTMFGCGDGSPINLAPAEGKSERHPARTVPVRIASDTREITVRLSE